MARKRPVMPSVAQIQEEQEGVAERLLDVLLRDTVTPTDEAFEVLDTGGPNMMPTSSSNPERPRTLKAGYDYATMTMTVVFRDGTWYDYYGVPAELWEGFKSADSKGKFLRTSGLDGWANKGPSELKNMPKHRREQMNDLKDFAQYMYGG